MKGNAPQPIATTAERLKEALAHRHMTAAELCRHTGTRAGNCACEVTITVDYPPAPSPGTTTQERIIYLQFRENMSQGELAAAGNTSKAAISKVVNNHHSVFCMDTIKALSNYFGLPYYFIGAYDQLPDNTIPEQLRKGRLYRLMTLDEAALFFGVSCRTYHNWEHGGIGSSGKAKRPDQDKLAEWIAVFRQNK